jgi:hypothetical protein
VFAGVLTTPRVSGIGSLSGLTRPSRDPRLGDEARRYGVLGAAADKQDCFGTGGMRSRFGLGKARGI